MGLRDDLAPVLARDARYEFEAYLLVLQSFEHARALRRRARARRPAPAGRPSPRRKRTPGHLSGQEIARAVRDLALRQFGRLAGPLLRGWGLTSTSDIGEIVYNLIAAGDLTKSDDDSRADFDDVFDLHASLAHDPIPREDDEP